MNEGKKKNEFKENLTHKKYFLQGYKYFGYIFPSLHAALSAMSFSNKHFIKTCWWLNQR